MTVSQHDLAHLAALIEAAQAHAGRLGPEVRAVCGLLEEALTIVRELQSNGGKADEGLRPQELTTENDE
ncbi:hypothetical protein [Enterovirga aerilata]|uniref:Uncharacterized protein n=1 Tax=Enterovirga aerilata TaxID=2730920 RepID=A0A849I8A6_9HYPH|nr:hypothetical protein [Enterovirga sp. DB1703]NNM72237.1 hypothetical protein [Enterovirga sp. DB1703]